MRITAETYVFNQIAKFSGVGDSSVLSTKILLAVALIGNSFYGLSVLKMYCQENVRSNRIVLFSYLSWQAACSISSSNQSFNIKGARALNKI